jgi:hypothetical protein
MAITKQQLQNNIYKRKSNGTPVISNETLRQPSQSDITVCKNTAETLLSYILAKHS